jgi:hypothetical protein
VFPRKLFFKENSAPEDGCGAVSGNNRRREGKVLTVGNGIDICKLTCRFKRRADIFRSFLFRKELILLDEFNINEAKYAADEECQFI